MRWTEHDVLSVSYLNGCVQFALGALTMHYFGVGAALFTFLVGTVFTIPTVIDKLLILLKFFRFTFSSH